MKPLVCIAGPTAVGKTKLSVELAKYLDGEIISADSMQVYRGLDIGSAKITEAEKQGIKHYLIDDYPFDFDYNVVRFQTDAKKALDLIYSKNKLPIITGGTGFYIQSIIKDVDFTQTGEDNSYRSFLEALARENGNEFIHNMLREIDPDSAAAIHPNNVKRVIRALEFARDTGRAISEHNREQFERRSPYNYACFVLEMPRQHLYERINLRVDKMMEDGLLDEVKALKDAGADRSMTSMQGLGYRQLLAYLYGECTLDEAVDRIKLETRHFAKRQITWFKREKDVIWLDVSGRGTEELMESIVITLKEKGIINA